MTRINRLSNGARPLIGPFVRRSRQCVIVLMLSILAACASTRAPLPTVADVKLERFMGDWYVIAHIPTFIERDAYNAIEHYDLAPDGTIATTFTFRKGSFDGPLKRDQPTGFIVDELHHATWGMQFIWPVKSEFLIAGLDVNYRTTIIARTARDYVWIMARTPVLADAEYAQLVEQVRALGYDTAQLRRVPQRW